MAMQDAITALERCRKPVIASIHGACIGGGIDIVTACDIRMCTKEAVFSVKEVDLALAADLGSLQRLPLIVGFGNAMELALTGRTFSGEEAKELGLVSRVFDSKDDLDQAVMDLAQGSFFPFNLQLPISVTKCNTTHSFIHSISSNNLLIEVIDLKQNLNLKVINRVVTLVI